MPYILRDAFRFAKAMNKAMTVFAIIALLYFVLPIAFGFIGRANPELIPVFVLIIRILPFLLLGAFAAYSVFFFLWLNQATINLHALHVPKLSYTPTMAVTWFFVPLANLVMPYFILSEVVRASDPVTDIPGKKIPWHFNPAPANLLMWWIGLQFCFFLLAYRVLNFFMTGEPITGVILIVGLAFLGFVFFLMNYLITIAGNVSENQILKYDAIMKAKTAIEAENAGQDAPSKA